MEGIAEVAKEISEQTKKAKKVKFGATKTSLPQEDITIKTEATETFDSQKVKTSKVETAEILGSQEVKNVKPQITKQSERRITKKSQVTSYLLEEELAMLDELEFLRRRRKVKTDRSTILADGLRLLYAQEVGTDKQ